MYCWHKHNKYDYSHNLVSVTHKPSGCQFHKWYLLAAITMNSVHQLFAVGVEKYILICWKLRAKICAKKWVLSCCFWTLVTYVSICSHYYLLQAPFNLAYLNTSKYLSQRQRQAYIKHGGWGLLHPQHVLSKHQWGLLECTISTSASYHAGNVHMHSMLLFEKVEREKRETQSVSDSPHAKITKTNLEGPTTVNGIRVIEHPHEVWRAYCKVLEPTALKPEEKT